MARTLTTETTIAAEPAKVWGVLTDFAALPQWAPFFTSIEGEPKAGTKLKVVFDNGFKIAPTVLAAEPGAVLEWQGKLAFGGLFDGRHKFELRAEGTGTRFTHSERFTGILIPFFGSMLRKTREGFEAFNNALRTRVEAA
jgi:hypothetical protein